MFRGTGTGSGGNPISSNWQQGMATNVCPGRFAHHMIIDLVQHGRATLFNVQSRCEHAANTAQAPYLRADNCT